jgi:hypothetical protein
MGMMGMEKHVGHEPTDFLLPRESNPVLLISNSSFNRASNPVLRKGDLVADSDRDQVNDEESDTLGATLRTMVQGPLSAADRSYQTSFLREIRAFRSCGSGAFDLDPAVRDQWEAHLGEECNMSVGLSFIGTGSEALIDIHVTNVPADPLQCLAMVAYPDLWPQLSLGRSVEKVRGFAPNDFFLDWTSKLLPMMPGSHNVFQVVLYDLMDDPEAGFLIAATTPRRDAKVWRDTQVPPLRTGHIRTELELMTILWKPTGPGMNDVTIRTKIDPKMPRWVLTGKVSRWLINKIARQSFSQFLQIIKDFESSDFSLRMQQDLGYFDRLRERLAEFETKRKSELATDLAPPKSGSEYVAG